MRYLDGDGGNIRMILRNDEVVGQNDDVVLNFFGHAFGSGGRQIEPNGVTEHEIKHEGEEKEGQKDLPAHGCGGRHRFEY